MIYPENYEKKIGFDEIRVSLRGYCLCPLGVERVSEMSFSPSAEVINGWMAEVREFRRLSAEDEDFALQGFFDVRESVARLRVKGTHMEEQELFCLMRSLQAISMIISNIRRASNQEAEESNEYPALWELARDVNAFSDVVRRINGILDKYGHIKDSASSALFHIRLEQKKMEGSISRRLNAILQSAQKEGLIEHDVTPTVRDGRLVIPIAPAMKRRIEGIVHDESASGKTLFIEPTAVVEANNRIRELEAEERREILRILTEVSDEIRPDADGILQSMKFLAQMDFIQAKAQLAESLGAIEPTVTSHPHIDWIRAVHPLLEKKMRKQAGNEEKKVVPLDITLSTEEASRSTILVISGPNAGGKSVCLKTVGLLQYMIQCGISVPMNEGSTVGVFESIMIDIGDEQSIEDDLSTYSSHLRNMKMMVRHANERTLLLIDEFGTGTEPQIGGAIAEAVLKQFWEKNAWGVITTHYQNLKHFAEEHPGVKNGAMLYDRHEMKALYKLQIGRPGSSFAIEIARKTGLPEEVIKDASDIVGQDYIQSDKYLQDIVRDKRYWEQKRQSIHQREKDVEKTITRYESVVEEIESERKAIIKRAKEQAEELLREANRRIENTIREIREAEAEKEKTRRLRKEMQEFRDEVNDIDNTANDAAIEKKMQQILARRERKAKRKSEAAVATAVPSQNTTTPTEPFSTIEIDGKSGEKATIGAFVRIKGTKTIGQIESIKGKQAVVIMGDIRTRMPLERLEKSDNKEAATTVSAKVLAENRATREVIESHRNNFHPEIDVRGMRGDEALMEVQHFIDDAILTGSSCVRILHGKGNGILRQLIRQYLNALPNVIGCRDEHVQFGGAGITVVDIG